MTDSTVLLALKLVAAKAAKLADDLEKGRLWEGDLQRGIAEIDAALTDATHSYRGWCEWMCLHWKR